MDYQVDLILCNPPRAQISLATLVDATTGRIVNEPDTGVQYRLRVLSCDAQGLHPGMYLGFIAFSLGQRMQPLFKIT
jgi:hypothetical protein